MDINSIPTPALILDYDIFLENQNKMKKLLDGKTLKLRPHYKSHKCARIAHMQIENGAIGMTCAKLEEAIDLADSGIENILIANQITDKSKISKLAFLAKACRLAVCVDDRGNVEELEKAASLADSTIYCLVEYEIGMNRCGVSSKEEVLSLAKLIQKCPHLVFEGIQAYAGHISHMTDENERKEKTEENSKKIKTLLEYLSLNRISVNVLSGGSTGTSEIKAKEGLYTELQAGSYLFMDSTYGELKLPFENSLFLLSTVVSTGENIVVVDAGVKSCGVDQGMPKCKDFEVSHIVASEEHFQLHNPAKKLKTGERVVLIPAHCCSTVNLHEKIYIVKDEKVIDRFEITSRGCFR